MVTQRGILFIFGKPDWIFAARCQLKTFKILFLAAAVFKIGCVKATRSRGGWSWGEDQRTGKRLPHRSQQLRYKIDSIIYTNTNTWEDEWIVERPSDRCWLFRTRRRPVECLWFPGHQVPGKALEQAESSGKPSSVDIKRETVTKCFSAMKRSKLWVVLVDSFFQLFFWRWLCRTTFNWNQPV